MKRRIATLIMALVLCLSLAVPSFAMTWDTDQVSWGDRIALPKGDEWKGNLDIDTAYAIEYINYDDSGMAGTVCYCSAPARVVLKTDAEPMDLGGSVVAITVNDNGEIYKDGNVTPTWQNPIQSEDFGVCNGTGTYWDLPEGLYYMFSVNASKTLFLVVGDPFGAADTDEQVLFADVPASEYYYAPVIWAIDAGITKGTSDTTFSPKQTCTQAQIITFLHRAAGEPEPSQGNAYSDTRITADKYYYKALLWAWENGIVTNKALNPNGDCQRSDVVTYLWKLTYEPQVEASNFNDVSDTADYAEAVSWAVATGITKGTSDTTFSPQATCTRGQIVTFLYRYFVELM